MELSDKVDRVKNWGCYCCQLWVSVCTFGQLPFRMALLIWSIVLVIFMVVPLQLFALNFVVNLKGQYSSIDGIYNFLSLDEVEIIKQGLAFNAIVGTVILSGNISTSLFFLNIRNWNNLVMHT